MFDEEKKSVIFVCDDKLMQYGRMISQMIEEKDDTENEVVGTKDGTLSASVWNEETYNSNESNLTSETKLVFIGDKIVNKLYPTISRKYDEFGMSYGKLGNVEVITVDKKALKKKTEYENFLLYCKEHSKDLDTINLFGTTAIGDILTKINDADKFHIGKIAAVYLFGVFAVGGMLFMGNKQLKEIERQQHEFVISHFYLYELNQFMEA